MTLFDFIKILLTYKRWLIILPLVAALSIFALTLNQKKDYTSQALLYTGIVPASDGTVNVQARVDVFAVNNAFDNIQTIITSRQVLEETNLHLIARHLMRKKNKPAELEKSITTFLNEHREGFADLPAYQSEEELFKLLQDRSQNSSIQWLLENDLSIYSGSIIKKNLKIKRSGSSDILEVAFTSNEATVAEETLDFLIDVFTKRYKEIRKSEVGSMVRFFEIEVAKAADRLTVVADEMKAFQMKNRIINYYEQTHLVAIETEHLNGQYYDELMKLAASERAFQDLKSKLGDPVQQALSSEEIVRSQQNISSLMTKKQLVESSSEEYQTIHSSIQKEEESLRKAISKLYVDGRTEEGVSKKDILRQWLDQFIALSEARARVTIMEQRKIKQEKEYDFFAPLGSALHNFERQMDVAEREYLDLLHSLNQARLRQQSAESSTLLSTVDGPNRPLKPEPSKRKLLVIVGWLGTLVMVMGVILFIEYFDSTLQSPERAENKTGLISIGALTNQFDTPIGKRAWSDFMLRFMANISGSDHVARRVLFISQSTVINGEAVASHLAKSLTQCNKSVAYCGMTSSATSELPIPSGDKVPADDKNVDFVFSVLPSLNDAVADWSALQNTDRVILLTNGESSWSPSDKQTVSLLEKIFATKPYLLLVDVDEKRLEPWMGELPKPRSRFRVLIKKIVQFQFH
jgi:uncharacterized protein involved in exopolysaccharide biosynthesis